MDIRKLQKIAVAALADIKAEDIEVINTRKLTALFDAIIVASGSSNRQVKALARNVHDKVKEAGGEVYGMEGGDTGEWVLVDLGDIVVHVMQPAVRAYYNLEELWRAAPKSATGDEAGVPKPKQVRVKKSAAPAITAPVKEAAAKPARKRAAASDAVAAPVPKKTATMKATGKKATSKKATTKQATTKKAPTKTAAAPAKALAAKPVRKRKPAGSAS